MTDAVLAELLTRLDLVVFERLPGEVFVRVGSDPPPSWFSRLSLSPREEAITIEQAMPFVGEFLAEANEAWRAGGEKRLCSGSVHGYGHDGWGSSACGVGRRRRQSILPDPRIALRLRRAARGPPDRTRERARPRGAPPAYRALLRPIDAAQQLMQQLTASGLTPNREILAARISEQLEEPFRVSRVACSPAKGCLTALPLLRSLVRTRGDAVGLPTEAQR